MHSSMWKLAVPMLVVASCLIACDEDPPGDVADVADTVPLLETTGDISVDIEVDAETAIETTPAETTDTAVPEDTAADTNAPQDTADTLETNVPQDTADTNVPQDTADTNVPQDTTDTNVAETTDTNVAETQDTTPDTGPEVIVDNGLNPGWVGGACDVAADCDYSAFNEPAACMTGDFPNGFCTQACRQSTTSGAWICPDAPTAGTDFTTTRCISANGTPRCVAECDFTKADSGCRPGYTCVVRSRHGQPNSVFPVCLPEPLQRWPGEPELADDIGEACNVASDCANRNCLALPGGYCSKKYCDTAGCPGASTCFGFSGGESSCLVDCGVDNECRTGEGYECDSDGTCWPGDSAPAWNSGVGAADCASAWGNAGSGLSTCDTTKDDYVVLRKSARNLALCNRGNLVANFQMGLGFAPIGDKQVEGDGKTPEGVFYVPQLVPESDYYLAFLVSYPDKSDATRGLAGNIITQAQKTAIDNAQTNCGTPPQSTGLGGWIEIHGEGGESDWTLGCAALDNVAIDVLWDTIGVRDTIVILP